MEDHQVPRLPGPEVHHRHGLHSLIKYIFTTKTKLKSSEVVPSPGLQLGPLLAPGTCPGGRSRGAGRPEWAGWAAGSCSGSGLVNAILMKY